MLREPARTRARSRRRLRKRESFWVKSRSRCACTGSARVFHEQLRVLAVQRHPINRRLVFVFLLQDAKEFVAGQPKRVPNEIILARNTNCFFADDSEFLDCRLRTIPVFALVLGAAIDIHQQRLAVRRNTKSIAAVHARISQNLRELPFLQNVSVQIDLVNVVEIVTENGFAVSSPFWFPESFTLQPGILYKTETGPVGV